MASNDLVTQGTWELVGMELTFVCLAYHGLCMGKFKNDV